MAKTKQSSAQKNKRSFLENKFGYPKEYDLVNRPPEGNHIPDNRIWLIDGFHRLGNIIFPQEWDNREIYAYNHSTHLERGAPRREYDLSLIAVRFEDAHEEKSAADRKCKVMHKLSRGIYQGKIKAYFFNSNSGEETGIDNKTWISDYAAAIFDRGDYIPSYFQDLKKGSRVKIYPEKDERGHTVYLDKKDFEKFLSKEIKSIEKSSDLHTQKIKTVNSGEDLERACTLIFNTCRQRRQKLNRDELLKLVNILLLPKHKCVTTTWTKKAHIPQELKRTRGRGKAVKCALLTDTDWITKI